VLIRNQQQQQQQHNARIGEARDLHKVAGVEITVVLQNPHQLSCDTVWTRSSEAQLASIVQVRRRLKLDNAITFVEDQEGGCGIGEAGIKKTKQRYSFHGFHCFEKNSSPILKSPTNLNAQVERPMNVSIKCRMIANVDSVLSMMS
jgi:hypothetical protein